MYCKCISNFQDLNGWSGTNRSCFVNMGQTMDSREMEQKNRKQPKRAKTKSENLRARDAYEHEEAKCGRCEEYAVKIFQLKEKRSEYKEKKRILKQENEKLRSQLNGRRKTDVLWQHVVSYVLP